MSIRLDQVQARNGLSRSTILAYMHEDRSPEPVQISERCVAWIESEVDAWISERVASRRHA